MGIWEMYTKFQSEHAELGDHRGDEGVSFRTILKRIVEKYGVGLWYEPVVGSCDRG